MISSSVDPLSPSCLFHAVKICCFFLIRSFIEWDDWFNMEIHCLSISSCRLMDLLIIEYIASLIFLFLQSISLSMIKHLFVSNIHWKFIVWKCLTTSQFEFSSSSLIFLSCWVIRLLMPTLVSPIYIAPHSHVILYTFEFDCGFINFVHDDWILFL